MFISRRVQLSRWTINQRSQHLRLGARQKREDDRDDNPNDDDDYVDDSEVDDDDNDDNICDDQAEQSNHLSTILSPARPPWLCKFN